jgi:hypothetical protein
MACELDVSAAILMISSGRFCCRSLNVPIILVHWFKLSWIVSSVLKLLNSLGHSKS